MGARAKQLNMFQALAATMPTADESEFVRREMQRLLWIVRTAERMPWSDVKAASCEKLFEDLAPALPGSEGADLLAAFQAELNRLRSA